MPGKKTLSLLTLSIILLLLGACSNRDAAQLGSLIGRSLGKPVGTLATAVDETLKTTGDVMRENPRYRQPGEHRSPQPAAESSRAEDAYYYRTEVLVKTRGPAQLESMTLQEIEDVSEFWR